jgi:hypothetical protein
LGNNLPFLRHHPQHHLVGDTHAVGTDGRQIVDALVNAVVDGSVQPMAGTTS